MNVVTGIHLFLFNFCFYLRRPSSEKRNGVNVAYSDPAGYHMVSLPSLNICTKHLFILFYFGCTVCVPMYLSRQVKMINLTSLLLFFVRNLADVDKDGKLKADEFILAMHLVDMAKLGQPLPLALPSDFVPPSLRYHCLIGFTLIML